MTAPVLVPPPSKSDAQRALVLADALGLPLDSVLPQDEALPGDIEVLRAGLAALSSPTCTIDCRDGGTPYRFLLTQAALRWGHVTTFTGTARLGERPHQPLLEALREALGPAGLVVAQSPEAAWPVVVRAPPVAQAVSGFQVGGSTSSQFASSLLLGAARLVRGGQPACTVRVPGERTSRGYLELTVSWLRGCGFEVEAGEGAWTITRAPVGTPGLPEVPGDWSSLGYLLMLAWRSGARVARVAMDAGHPDAAIVSHLASVGLQVVVEDGAATVTGQGQGGLDVDVEVCPDSALTLAALACVLPAPSVFRRTRILVQKESDRLEGLVQLVSALGGAARVEEGAVSVTPGAPPASFHFDAKGDHRLAMSAAVGAALTGARLTLAGPEAVAKSFPGFWREAAKVGLALEAAR